uniref:Uncharacterized protein n=1 Tax=Cucumis sativus TaxID=3659 RepID=A0A0A0LDI6_CUCSA
MATPWSLKKEFLSWVSFVQESLTTVTWESGTKPSQSLLLFGLPTEKLHS